MNICQNEVSSEERQLMKWVGILWGGRVFQWGVWLVGIFWMGIFPGGTFLEPFFLKVRLPPFKKNCCICFNKSPLKSWKIHSIWSLKLFSFSRYLNFSLTFWSRRRSDLIKKDKDNFKIYDVTTWLTNKLQRTYCQISHEVKAASQWHLVS